MLEADGRDRAQSLALLEWLDEAYPDPAFLPRDIEARYTVESSDGGLVVVNSAGLRHGPPDVIEKLGRGEPVDPSLYYFRTLMRFETAQPSLRWLNTILALARGERRARSVRLDVFEVL